MTRLAAVLFAIALPLVVEAVNLTEGALRVHLDDDWTVRTLENGDHVFFSHDKRSQVVLTYMPRIVPSNERLEAARKIIRNRKDVEQNVAAPRRVTIKNESINEEPQATALLFNGFDDKQRYFHFYGAITPRGILLVYCETLTSSEEENAGVIQAFLAGVKL